MLAYTPFAQTSLAPISSVSALGRASLIVGVIELNNIRQEAWATFASLIVLARSRIESTSQIDPGADLIS